jgi:signal transduction histidine kinase
MEYSSELERNQNEIELLNQQKKTQQNFLITISVIFPMMILTAFGLFRLSRQKTKYIHQRQLLISTVQTQEDERKRIAQDLHDEMGAVLSIARMHLVQIQEQEGGGINTKATIQQAQTLTESAIATMRRISHELMPPQLEEFGLIKTLRAIAKQVNESKKIKLEIVVADDLPRWAATIELGLYRICMELINNTLKHAEAQNINIRLAQVGNQIVCSYSDDGKGLRENYLEGHGFRNIEARLNSLGGSRTMGNQPNGGFYAALTIPLNEL